MMPWASRTLARLAALFRRERFDRELEEDVATHIELLTDEYVARGMDRADARREARLKFGSVDAAMELHRDVRSLRWLETSFQDLRYAARLLRRQPLLTCAVVLTLGIGIGAPVAAFSLMNGFVFRTPQSADPDAFFRVVRRSRHSSGVATVPEYLALLETSKSVRELAAWSGIELRGPIGSEDPAPVEGLFVSCNFFRLLGVNAPVAGRLLASGDCAASVPVAVISERIWRERFNADPSIVGASVRYGGSPVTIVGVASAPPILHEWDDPDFSADVWAPYSAQPALKGPSEFLSELMHHDHHRWLEIAGLLAPGVSRETAQAELRTIDENQPAARESREPAPLVLTDGSRWAAAPLDMLTILAMTLALPALVMLTACVNVAALLLPRAVNRQREMAVRLTLGTSKARLLRMLLLESLLVCGVAAMVSLALVYTLPPMLVRFFDMEQAFGADAIAPDWRVFACLAFAGILAAVIAGLAPALESLNPRLADTLKSSRGLIFRRRPSRSRRVFVGIQIAASMVLLVVAATFARTADRFSDPGFRTEGVLVADVREQPKPGVPLSSIARQLRATAGIGDVAYASTLPLVREWAMRIRIHEQAVPVSPLIVAVSSDYFRVLDIPLLAGQSFPTDDAGIANPIIVSRQFARRFFGESNPIGQVVEGTTNAGPKQMTIIGIAADREVGRSSIQPALTDGSVIYERMPPTSRSGHLLVRMQGDANATAGSLRLVLRNVIGSAALVQTLQSSLAQRVAGVRRMQVVLLAMGAISLALAIIGVIGAVSADASQRRKEFAIRLAIGATPWNVRRSIMTSGLRPIPIALAAGALASWGALRAGENVVPVGAVAGDPAPYVVIAVFLLAASFATLLAVAYPAGRRDPVVSLRED